MVYCIFCDVGWVFSSMPSRLQSDPDHTGLRDLQIPFILFREMQSPSEISLGNRQRREWQGVCSSSCCRNADENSVPGSLSAQPCPFSPRGQAVPVPSRFPPWRTSSFPGLLCPPGLPPKGFCQPDPSTGSSALSDNQLGAPDPGRDQRHLEAFLNTNFCPISTRVQLTNSATTTNCAPYPKQAVPASPAPVPGLRGLAGHWAVGSRSPMHLQPPSGQPSAWASSSVSLSRGARQQGTRAHRAASQNPTEGILLPGAADISSSLCYLHSSRDKETQENLHFPTATQRWSQLPHGRNTAGS